MSEREHEGASGDWDVIGTETQGPVKTHGENACRGQVCVIHNPSDHHMRDWPLSFSFRHWGVTLGRRTCPHGQPHPDPDSVAYLKGVAISEVIVHGHACDGCCRPPRGTGAAVLDDGLTDDPGSVLGRERVRELYEAALLTGYTRAGAGVGAITMRTLVDALMEVRDRELQMLRQRLRLAQSGFASGARSRELTLNGFTLSEAEIQRVADSLGLSESAESAGGTANVALPDEDEDENDEEGNGK